MSKAILLSVKPQYVAKILNGEKTIEIRKHAIPVGTKVYVYCTKDKPYIVRDKDMYFYESCCVSDGILDWHINGKVVASFAVEYCWELEYNKKRYIYIRSDYRFDSFQKYVVEKSCVNNNQMYDYGKEKPLFAWHISQLKIFDRPKELNELSGITKSDLTYVLTKAPQSFVYVEEIKDE